MDYFMCLLMASAIVAIGSATGTTQAPTQHQQDMHMMQTIYDELKQLKQTVGGLARQTMLQQLFVEERIRSEGGSGLKQVRAGGSGTRPYHHTLHAAGSAAGIHEHSNYDRTVGLGELIVVLNGVEFRTRHNDYKLKMPSTKSKNYNEVEDIPFPNVPPSVLNKHNVSDQIAEMREFFKAFHKQDIHHRDYRPYFKPVMCYLEGGWTTDTRNYTAFYLRPPS
ncbi:uncharacterized protein LOC128204753 [Mya arenaria]|uniref:uncharacterized protein LOC128204753 n=1 Tax=Mya arenaria TaxID=6604 RepID=UPI0022E08455|nr:uncharacterized protein LOC128204753 [Mya arenaria]